MRLFLRRRRHSTIISTRMYVALPYNYLHMNVRKKESFRPISCQIHRRATITAAAAIHLRRRRRHRIHHG